jgi:hypothetical protein
MHDGMIAKSKVKDKDSTPPLFDPTPIPTKVGIQKVNIGFLLPQE